MHYAHSFWVNFFLSSVRSMPQNYFNHIWLHLKLAALSNEHCFLQLSRYLVAMCWWKNNHDECLFKMSQIFGASFAPTPKPQNLSFSVPFDACQSAQIVYWSTYCECFCTFTENWLHFPPTFRYLFKGKKKQTRRSSRVKLLKNIQ